MRCNPERGGGFSNYFETAGARGFLDLFVPLRCVLESYIPTTSISCASIDAIYAILPFLAFPVLATKRIPTVSGGKLCASLSLLTSISLRPSVLLVLDRRVNLTRYFHKSTMGSHHNPAMISTVLAECAADPFPLVIRDTRLTC